MNIQVAKEYIKDSVRLYLKKDAFGHYRVPVVRQRPIFLLGAPGIGKTAIMEQIAQELGIALVSYSMTHHTRQSALGLPFITTKNYGGQEYSVSEYTMSEIIASIYETMENSGVTEGILFLDEINCVSETLAPSMLQFLQYKVFGRHQVPEGWVIVTAGNPPEYNKSVREFDVVTMDRLKLLEVNAELAVWRKYAAEKQVHSAILNYLDLKKDHFYVMEMTAAGRSYVTARGWEDLSEMLKLCEEEKLPVDESLVGQYIHCDRVIKEFTVYYDLYNKYKRDYRIADILSKGADEAALDRAKNAAFDERLSLLGMLLDRVKGDMKEVTETLDYLTGLRPMMVTLKTQAQTMSAEEVENRIRLLLDGQKNGLEKQEAANSLSDKDRKRFRRTIAFLEKMVGALAQEAAPSGEEAFLVVSKGFNEILTALQQETGSVLQELHYLFDFAEKAYAEGNEMLILVTELTTGTASSAFLAHFGSADYAKHSSELMLTERGADLAEEIGKLDL